MDSEGKQVQKSEGSISERFTMMVMKEYSSEVGKIDFNEYHQRLAQHLFIKTDMALAEAEKRRLESNKNSLPIIWQNINLQRLAVDAVHRIELGLDALIPNHLHPIPYFNTRAKKYDVDLRIGYAGKDFYHRPLSLYPLKDIRYELVYENDTFDVFIKDRVNQIEAYSFKIENPFRRGHVVGGFGFIEYEDETKNKVVIVTIEDFAKAERASGTNKFWGPHKIDMQWKTIVHRTVKKIILDPNKINKSFAFVEDQDYQDNTIDISTQRHLELPTAEKPASLYDANRKAPGEIKPEEPNEPDTNCDPAGDDDHGNEGPGGTPGDKEAGTQKDGPSEQSTKEPTQGGQNPGSQDGQVVDAEFEGPVREAINRCQAADIRKLYKGPMRTDVIMAAKALGIDDKNLIEAHKAIKDKYRLPYNDDQGGQEDDHGGSESAQELIALYDFFNQISVDYRNIHGGVELFRQAIDAAGLLTGQRPQNREQAIKFKEAWEKLLAEHKVSASMSEESDDDLMEALQDLCFKRGTDAVMFKKFLEEIAKTEGLTVGYLTGRILGSDEEADKMFGKFAEWKYKF